MSDKSFEEDLAQLGKLKADAIQGHPEPALLMDYKDNLLDETQTESLESHIAICRTCADLLLGANEPLDLEEDMPEMPKQESLPPKKTNHFLPWLAAAAIFACCAFLFIQNLDLKKKLDTNNAPRTVFQIADLNPVDDPTRSGVQATTPSIDSDEELTLFLNTIEAPRNNVYDVRISRDDILVWEGSIRPASGQFMLGLPGSLLKPGSYKIVILVDSSSEKVAAYSFKVR